MRIRIETYGSLKIWVSTSLWHGGVKQQNLLNWALDRTHLLNKMTLELKAIHRLGRRLARMPGICGRRGDVRDVEGRVQALARGRGSSAALELAFILRRATVCHCFEISPQRSDYG